MILLMRTCEESLGYEEAWKSVQNTKVLGWTSTEPFC